MGEKITPRNRTARAAGVVGNPANTRLDSSVANCFPGLEVDVRNLDNRFFPGLLFQVVTAPLAPVEEAPPDQQGVRLLYLDFQRDPMLPENSTEPWVQELLALYNGDTGIRLSQGRWYLEWIEQSGRRISLYDDSGKAYDGELVWRILRGIEPDRPVTISLVRRDADPGAPPPTVQLTGYRRPYAGERGVIDSVYEPGELTQSLCNPWSHDFRDCACYYWAANHPDVVMGEARGATLPDGEPRDPTAATVYLDWLRRDRGPAGAAAAPNTRAAARPYQMDHYEINHRWEELAFVLEGREIDKVYTPRHEAPAPPYADAREMIEDLESRLAPMEMTLAIEYLYALFSLRAPEEAPADRWPTLRDDVTMSRQFFTLLAVGEMTHMRWANRLLWELDRAGFYPKGRHYRPVVRPAPQAGFGTGRGHVPRLQRLTYEALDEYARVERPGGAIDTAYARCVATLERPGYPRHLYELAVHIDTDGMHHYERVREVHKVLAAYRDAEPPYPYLRDVRLGTEEETREALALYELLRAALERAYAREAAGDPHAAQADIDEARRLMDRLREEAERVAANGIGIPFWRPS